MIFTFYSYKGGVGRSMALANIARWFQLRGLKVVMVDWDLEAPGLESFFTDDAEPATLRSRLGLLDLLGTYKDIFPSLPRVAPAEATSAAPEARQPGRVDQMLHILEDTLPPLSHVLAPIQGTDPDGTGGKLWLLPAGSRDETRFAHYAEMVQSFDWSEFYDKYEGEAFFEWMRRQLQRPEVADVVLIDSRTGVAEMSGVCTRQLADVVVILCAPNDQNLDGVAMMAGSFSRPDVLKARGQRPIQLVMVPARIDLSEGRPLDRFQERFQSKLASYLPPVFRQLGTNFERLRIPYIREYAYAERLAVGQPDGVKALQDAYATIATHLALLAPADSELKRHCRDVMQTAFGMRTALIAPLEAADAAFASDLRQQLEAAGVLTQTVKGSADSSVELASHGEAVVLVVRPASLGEARLRQLWRRGRQQGVPMYLMVLGSPLPGNADGESPRWLRGDRPLYVASGGSLSLPAQFLEELRTRHEVPRVPFLAPPAAARFFGRSNEFQKIKELLFATGSAAPVALVGLRGAGKTALARAVCNDEEVIDEFGDGILWTSLGPGADVPRALAKLVAAFEGSAPVDAAAVDADEIERRLAEHLANKRCLLVLDDVYEPGQVERVSLRTGGSRLLITTDARDVALKLNAIEIEIGALDTENAQRVLLHNVAVDEAAPAVKEVMDQIGPSVLALSAANANLRTWIKQGMGKEQALSELAARLQIEGLAALEFGQSADPATSISAALEAAMERLEPEDRARFPQLASLPEVENLELDVVAKGLGLAPEDTEQMLRRLSALSLVAFDASQRTLRIHPVVRAYARSLQVRHKRYESTRAAFATPTDFNVYVSYRREDSAPQAGRIYDRLAERFGPNQVFMDVHDISPGRDFVQVIEEKLATSNAMIVVIGPNWLKGIRDEGSDVVSQEVAIGLARGLPVIPVLVEGTRMPTAEELPPALASLARRVAMTVNESRFNQDVEALIKATDLSRVFTPAEATGAGLPEAPPGELQASGLPVNARTRAWKFAAIGAAVVGGSALFVMVAHWWARPQVPSKPPEDVVAIRPGPPPLDGGKPQDSESLEVAVEAFTSGGDYEFGRAGLKQDYGKAAKLYRVAADLGYTPALNALGRFYENGLGVPQVEAEAIKWYRLAADAGHPDAQAALTRIEMEDVSATLLELRRRHLQENAQKDVAQQSEIPLTREKASQNQRGPASNKVSKKAWKPPDFSSQDRRL